MMRKNNYLGQKLITHTKKIGPEVVNEVNNKTLDVRAILILIGHDHKLAVAERLKRVILLAILQTLN